MPLCSPFIRAAIHSCGARFVSPPSKPLAWHNSVRSIQRSHTTALAEHRRGEEPAPSDDSQAPSDTQYLDFVLAGYGAPKAAEKTVAQPVASESLSPKRALGLTNQKGRRRSRPVQPRLSNEDRARVKARVAAHKRSGNLRPFHQSIRSDLRTSAVFSSAWNTRYFRLARPYDRGLLDHYLKEPQSVTFRPEVTEWVDELLEQMQQSNNQLAIEAYARHHGKLGREVWAEVALWLQSYQKDKLIDFLEATHTPLYPPINWVEDCLYYLARHYALTEMNNRHSWFQLLIQLFLKLVDRDTNEQYIFNSGFFRPLLPHCTDRQVTELYGTIKLGKVKVTHNTLLHFADHFARNGHTEQSLDALLQAKHAGADVNGVAYRSGCATLLRRSIQHPGGLRVCLRLIENLVNVGVKLNRVLCNLIMLNAVEARDLDTADAVHRSALEQGFVPDAYTCAIRLKACKVDISNMDRLKEAIEEAINNGDVRQNVVVATEIVHCLALHHTLDRSHSEAAFTTVATAYMQLFDPAPLERLGVPMPEALPTSTEDHPEQRMVPSRHAINFVLALYLTHGGRGRDPSYADRLYTRWRELVEAGFQPLAACATTSHTSNIFLKKFSQNRNKLVLAAAVVKDMQKPLPGSAGVEQAKPDVHTWSIFLQGFANKGETKLAEQVLRYMRGKGIEPNQVTWTSLVTGYAAVQDSEGLLDALRRMGQSGSEWNEWTHKGLRRFGNRQKLKELLEAQRLQQSLDFSGELKEGLVHKLSDPGDATQEYGSLTEAPSSGGVSDVRNAGAFADSPAELAMAGASM